jgi:aldehyde dehydrogenase (NAD+)
MREPGTTADVNLSSENRATSLFESLGLAPRLLTEGDLSVSSPIDGSEIARVRPDDEASTSSSVERAVDAFRSWRITPAPVRGEVIRLLGEELRTHKQDLAALVTLENGKIYQEALGEVQEMIDICDFAVGLSRQLYGLTMPSERKGHRLAESWHPMGVVAVITAFNFPVAVWSWNAALAVVCGNAMVWKPSDATPLTALACAELFRRAMARHGDCPEHLMQVVVGDATIGAQLAADRRIPVVSATGSTSMGRAVGPVVAGRLGRSILELGGNNGMIVAPSADLDMAVRAIIFGAVGTAGQRCTTLRRLIAHRDVCGRLFELLKRVYGQVKVGNPFDPSVLVGPLIDESARLRMQSVLDELRGLEGCEVFGGESVEVTGSEGGSYVSPAIVRVAEQNELVKTETFAPILYVLDYEDFEEAIELHNGVPQGLSSSLFTTDLREAELFLSAAGSDCGLANINIGPSGAEIGGAFGGEKDTGGGRESGSDAWKGYMRRSTSTVNYSRELPLAQGIEFNV